MNINPDEPKHCLVASRVLALPLSKSRETLNSGLDSQQDSTHTRGTPGDIDTRRGRPSEKKNSQSGFAVFILYTYRESPPLLNPTPLISPHFTRGHSSINRGLISRFFERDLRQLAHGEDRDLFDALYYVAYQKDLMPRLDRAEQAKIHINDYDAKQQAFLNFVLRQHVKEGVTKLDDAKLGGLIKLNYGSIHDGKVLPGGSKEIRETFIGSQQHLNEKRVS